MCITLKQSHLCHCWKETFNVMIRREPVFSDILFTCLNVTISGELTRLKNKKKCLKKGVFALNIIR